MSGGFGPSGRLDFIHGRWVPLTAGSGTVNDPRLSAAAGEAERLVIAASLGECNQQEPSGRLPSVGPERREQNARRGKAG